MTVVTRFAPSPTGYLHIGGARTALYSWLHARHHGGRFLLRIEDTDRERSTPEAVQAIRDGMAWLGLEHDGEIVYQTDRFERYRELISWLVDGGRAYPCYCSRQRLDTLREAQRAAGEKPRYDGHCRPEPGKTLDAPPAGSSPVIRFATPTTGETRIADVVKGDLVLPNAELDDLIIQRSDGSPTYNFCVVVDDLDAGITHVVRGDDHVNNTPRQIAILEALGGQAPVYAHLPMILGADGKRLSKRHGAVSVLAYREAGYLPQALLNYLLRLGFSKGDQEIFSLDQMVANFDLARVQRSAARFDPAKLEWVNYEHMRAAQPERLAPELAWHLRRLGVEAGADPPLTAVAAHLQERSKTLVEMAEKALFLYRDVQGYEEKALAKHLKAPGAQRLAEVREALASLQEWEVAALHAAVHGVAEAAGVGLGKVAQPIRVALTGTPVSPPIEPTLLLLGRERSLARLDAAMEYLEEIRRRTGDE